MASEQLERAALPTRPNPGVHSWQAIDNREPTPSLHLLQTHHVASRFGLSADRARLVAALAFTGAPQ